MLKQGDRGVDLLESYLLCQRNGSGNECSGMSLLSSQKAEYIPV